MPAGGMAPTRSFRITISHVSALAGMFAVSIFSSVKPPVLARSLWQVTQYLSRSACCGVGAAVCARAAVQGMAAQAIAKPQLVLIIRTLLPIRILSQMNPACKGGVVRQLCSQVFYLASVGGDPFPSRRRASNTKISEASPLGAQV